MLLKIFLRHPIHEHALRAYACKNLIAHMIVKRFARDPNGGATAFCESLTRSRYDRKFTSRESVSIKRSR